MFSFLSNNHHSSQSYSSSLNRELSSAGVTHTQIEDFQRLNVEFSYISYTDILQATRRLQCVFLKSYSTAYSDFVVIQSGSTLRILRMGKGSKVKNVQWMKLLGFSSLILCPVIANFWYEQEFGMEVLVKMNLMCLKIRPRRHNLLYIKAFRFHHDIQCLNGGLPVKLEKDRDFRD